MGRSNSDNRHKDRKYGRRNEDDDFVPDFEEEDREEEEEVMDLTVEEDEAKFDAVQEDDEEYRVESDIDADDIQFEEEEDEEFLSDEDEELQKKKKKKRVQSRRGTRRSGGAPVGQRRSKKPGARGRGETMKISLKRRADTVPVSQYEDFDLEAAFDSDADADDGTFVLGAADEEFHDFSGLVLKADHMNRPLWVCPDGRIFLETFSPVYKQAYDFLIAVAEPVSRPEVIHEYMLTPHSLYAAVSIGLDTATILTVLDRLSKSKLPAEVRYFVRESTSNYGKVKLVLQRNRYFVESPYPKILKKLLRDSIIKRARVLPKKTDIHGIDGDEGDHTLTTEHQLSEFRVTKALKDNAVANLASLGNVDLKAAAESAKIQQMEIEQEERNEMEIEDKNDQSRAHLAEKQSVDGLFSNREIHAEEDPDRELHAFEIDASQVEHVKARCLPDGLNYPMLEEYDFQNDTSNPTLNFELKPHVKHRPYQEKSLSKMFGNSRARSGIIVLPCGAGKSLVGVSAAARIKKATLCLCTNAVSVDQWKYQFQLWTSLRDDQVCRFTSDKHEWFAGQGAGVCITTYTMVAYSGRRSEGSERIMNEIISREWGLILLDEVHVVPAMMFRKVLAVVKAHCKLGLTATLVREDQLITDLNFLIGPKLYEANWLDLTRGGHIASVQCAEVWCPMTPEFMREYLRAERTAPQKQLLYVMNPTKLRACQYLVQYHEARGDKVIVFSDNLFALREYAVRMQKPFLYGGTGHQERTRVLHAFKTNPSVNTIFLSKVGDNSLDIPEANVLIQVSSHGGSRRQEAQRLGRILRKKRSRPCAPGSGEEFDAFFYTLVSTDTQEVFFTGKRQQFLIDQGYSYKVIPSLLESVGGGGDLLLAHREEQIDLLAAVLHVSEAEATADDFPDVQPSVRKDITSSGDKKKGIGRRALGNMAALSGSVGMKYLEFATDHGKGSGSSKNISHRSGISKFAKLRKTH